MGISAESAALGSTGYQRDIWAAEARTPGTCQFNVLVHERLVGDVDREVLGACLDRAVREHDAFRLRFAEDAEGVPRVRRAEQAGGGAPLFDRVDLSGEPLPRPCGSGPSGSWPGRWTSGAGRCSGPPWSPRGPGPSTWC